MAMLTDTELTVHEWKGQERSQNIPFDMKYELCESHGAYIY